MALGDDVEQSMASQDELDSRIRRFYAEHADEGARLTSLSAAGRVELERVRRILTNRLAPGSTVLDVGGATGIHARWLATQGHTVTMIDPVPEQVAIARRDESFVADVGDARNLEFDDAGFDAVLLFGPLYHLITPEDRLTALREAVRVLRVGGQVFAAAISRMAAATDIILGGDFRSLPGAALVKLLETGQNSPEIEGPDGVFPAGHFHTAAELVDELQAAGLRDVEIVGLEGPAAFALEMTGPTDRVVAAALTLAEDAQGHPLSVNLSSHLLAIGRRG